MPKNSERGRIEAAIRRDVPRSPGVYRFYDKSGSLVYVGKSVNLRERMLSYFRANAGCLENRIGQMVFNIHDFDFRETETELMALLLEDALIKRELPIYNIRQQEYNSYQYLQITDDPYPTCKAVERRESGARHFYGPFHDGYAVDGIISFMHRNFRLRSCKDPRPSRRCLDYDLGLCSGPCRDKIALDAYSRVVRRAVDFLEGNESWLEDTLQREMARCCGNHDFERAAGLQAQLGFCKSFCARQRFIHEFKTKRLSVHEPGSQLWAYHFDRGSLVEATQTLAGVKREATIPEPLFEAQTDERFLLDRGNLVYVWLNGKNGRLHLSESETTPGLHVAMDSEESNT